MFCKLYPTHYPKRPSLNRILGNPVGIAADQLPRFEGHLMQHLMTLDLQTVPIELPGSNGYRAVAIFIASLIDNDANIPNSGETQVIWITQNNIDHYGELSLSTDWSQEPVEPGSPTFDVEAAVDIIEAETSNYVGGVPLWAKHRGEPEQSLTSAFIMRLSSLDFPFVPFDAFLYVFVQDAFWQPSEYSAAPPPWRDLTSVVFQLAVLQEELPDSSSCDRYGGLPPCGSMFEWVRNLQDQPLSHVMTLDAARFRYIGLEGDIKVLDEEILAVSLFYDPNWQGNWQQETPYRLVFLSDRDLDRQFPLKPPDYLTILPEARIQSFSCDTTQSRTILSQLSLISPRPAWRVLCPYPQVESFILQLVSEHLPTSPEQGTLYLYLWNRAIWQSTSDNVQPSNMWEPESPFFLAQPFGESMTDQQLDNLRDQIRILRRGDGSAGYVGGLPIGIAPENLPTYQGKPMTHILTLYTQVIPGLSNRSYAGIAVFLSSAWQHEAFLPGNDHAAVILLSQVNIDSGKEVAQEGVEILSKYPLQAHPVPQTMSVNALLQRSFAGGSPIWLQNPEGDSRGFVLQLNDDVVSINLADSGTFYVYETTAWIQSL